jgi:hypothetical protein
VVAIAPEDLVKRFVDAYYKAQSCLDSNDLAGARQQYLVLLQHYQAINGSALSYHHKELAHSQMLKIKERFEEPAASSPLPIIFAGIFIVLISFVVFMEPSIVGLVFFSQEKLSADVNWTITKSGFYNVTLEGIPTSLMLRGNFAGKSAKVYLTKGKNLLKIFDSSKANIANSSFDGACIDTCSIADYPGNKINLLVEVQDATLVIKRIDYTAKPLPNKPPAWNGPSVFPVFGRARINLSKYFSDADGDSLVYLATKAPGARVSVVDDALDVDLDEDAGKNTVITVMASDMKSLTRVPLTLQKG